MKTTIFTALVATAFAQQLEGIDRDIGKTRAQIGHIVVKSGIAPLRQDLKARFQDYNPNVKRTKVRYGPYSLPGINERTLMSSITGEAGTMSTIGSNLKKPCDGTCGLVTAQAGLEYADGTVADNSNGAWLHHVVMLAAGPNRKDNVCGRWLLPGERFFSSGNERTPTAFGDVLTRKVKSVFVLTPQDTISAQLELMNLVVAKKSVYLTVDYEYIPGDRPQGYKIAKAMWLDVTNCGASSVRPPSGKQSFTLSSKPWSSSFNGEMLGVGGHLHDGGINLDVKINNKVVCDSQATYGLGGHSHKKRGPLSKRDGPSADGKVHIKTMSTCSTMGKISKGDKVHIEANYDFTKREGMKSKSGSFNSVMGIAIMYAAAEV